MSIAHKTLIKRVHQLLSKTSKGWYLQVFSKLVESNYSADKTDKYSPEKQTVYDKASIQ